MLKKMSFDKKELEIILESLERQRRYTKLWWPGDKKVTIDNLITQFKIMNKNYKKQKPYDATPRIKKARQEYEKIFFERYGVK
tara:strand:- start:604 stop:852 length:249 start_codon:yes stop_codon:yes gene_type:complete